MVLSTIDGGGLPYLVNLEEVALLEVISAKEEDFEIRFFLKGNPEAQSVSGPVAEALFSRFVQYNHEQGNLHD